MSQTVYATSNLYFIIPRFDRKYPPLEKVILPFSKWIYFLIIFVFFKVIALYYIFREQFSEKQSQKFIYNLLVSSLGSPLENIPTKNFPRFLVTCWLVLFLIIRTSYCSFLYYFLRSDMRIVQPITIQSVLDDYKIFSTDMMYNLLNAQPNVQSKLIHEFIPKMQIFEKAFRSGDEHGKSAYLMNFEMYGWLRKNKTWVRNRLYLVPQVVLAQQFAINTKKNSFLRPVLYDRILLFTSFGLLASSRKEHMDIKNINKFANEVKIQSMNFQDVSGIFVVWAFFLLLSFVVFLWEVMSVKCKIWS